jgi:hypothetical protein
MATKRAFCLLIGLVMIGVQAFANEQDKPAKDVTFILSRLPENPGQYSLALADQEERSISGVFSVSQLLLLRALMTEAEKFALSTEGVGQKEAVVTRFVDKQEQSFIVDVEKLGNQSKLFLTLNTELGRMTAEGGSLNRVTKREDGFFFDLLDRLDALTPKPAK